MATTKLTLSMEPEVVYRAKKYAKNRNISLSRLIQDFLEKSIENETPKDNLKANIPHEIQSLIGILKGPAISKKQLREMKSDHLKEKYGL
ncbi:MAG: DUF6364 family protein [Daejeonella sp.]